MGKGKTLKEVMTFFCPCTTSRYGSGIFIIILILFPITIG
jgi:hypothetical protein